LNIWWSLVAVEAAAAKTETMKFLAVAVLVVC
jgi:hypothetical protein